MSLSLCQEVEKRWKVVREEQGITSRATSADNKTYEQRYWSFITEHFPNKFQSWRQFDLAKSFLHSLTTLLVDAVFFSWVSEHVDFLAKGLETATVVQVLHSVSVNVTKVWKSHVNLGRMFRFVVRAHS